MRRRSRSRSGWPTRTSGRAHIASWVAAIVFCGGVAREAHGQSADVPLAAGNWTFAGDSSRFESFLGQPSLRVGRGVAIAHGVDLRNGTIDFDMAADSTTPFLGVAFHVQSADNFEDVFFRVGASGTSESVQYTPWLTGENAWELVHGPDANGVATIPRNQWVRVRVVLAGDTATIYAGSDTAPVLVVPRLASGIASGSIGFWTGPFGRGGYFSNLRYTADPRPHPPAPRPALAAGTIVSWELSEALDAATLHPAVLPRLSTLHWDHVQAEPWKPYHDRSLGLVLINRYRRGANVTPPRDSVTGEILTDSVMDGRVAGTKVVFARSVIQSDRAQLRRMHFGYANGVVVFVNGIPLFFGANPFGMRDLGGVMETTGEAVYLPLKKGHNEIVLAVTDFFAGWGFWTRLDQ